MNLNLLLFKVTLAVYLGATVLYLIELVGRKNGAGKSARWVLRCGLAVHVAALVSRYFEGGHPPLASLHESLSFFALLVVAAYLLFDLKYRTTVMGSFVSPLALALMGFSLAAPVGIIEPNPILNSWWFPVHVIVAMLGYSAFALAAIAGIMYLIQERLLKRKDFSNLYYKLPSLSTLDEINYRCLTFGFLFMSMGIVTGAVWANSAWGGYWRWDPKEVWALVTWFLYAAQLHGRLTIGWRGKRAAIFAIAGFAVIIFSYVGVNLLYTSEHSFKVLTGQ